MLNITTDQDLFEKYLIEKFQKDPNAELAEVLIKEYAAHINNNTKCTKDLEAWIDDKLVSLSDDSINVVDALALNGKWSRPKIEINFINMNVYIWNLIFDGLSLDAACEKTAKSFSTSAEIAKTGFERKNHDFGTREMCRFALDIYIAMTKTQLVKEDIETANSLLLEDMSIQMNKDLNHHRAKYANA